MGLTQRLKHMWNAFTNKKVETRWYGGYASSRPNRPSIQIGGEQSVVGSIYNRIAIDAAAIRIRHVRLDDKDQYKSTIKSGLNECLTHQANKDQTGRSFIQDVVLTLCYEGCAAIVPIELPKDPSICPLADMASIRVGKVMQWQPDQVLVKLYNDNTGQLEDIWVPKSLCALPENPLYSVMNEPNSTAKRLVRKLNLLDQVDEKVGSEKLDLIIQLPYTVRSELQQQQAKERLKDIEMQLSGSKHGIAYIGATEHVTQLNRPIENNLLEQIDYNTQLLYSQLGMDETVFNGTADEATMLNYHNRTIEPILAAIVDAMDMKFITKTARTQGQAIRFFRDPFRLVPVEQLSEIADKLLRNQILTSNEFRAIIGYAPVDDPKANELRNPNLNESTNEEETDYEEDYEEEEIDEGTGVDNSGINTVFK